MLRLGELLVQQGHLTEEQVEEILEAQRECGRPFGYLAEKLFGLSVQEIEGAWAKQYEMMTGTVDLDRERIDREVNSLVSRRQAWQFGIMPLRRHGSELLVGTTVEHLPRAVRFVTWHIDEPTSFVITSNKSLEAMLRTHYNLPGMSLESCRAKGLAG
ncbi:MAG: hypothetical protein KJZ69_13020 [Phycisphaerales bacterium]|nr:hypothetical protein [Phycisphaerales bacterium]